MQGTSRADWRGGFGPLASLFDLSGQVALVTGGSRGLGLQIAEALGQAGARVVLTSRRQADLGSAADRLQASGTEVETVACDISRVQDVESLVDWIEYRTAGLDILVNNAGATWGAPTEDHPLESWRKVIDTNLTGAFLLSQAVGRRWMIPRGNGAILNIASVEGLRGHHHALPATIGYSTTKGGLVNFTRALAAEWGQHGIRVNALAPGYFRSKMTNEMLDSHESGIVSRTPLGRLGGPDDLKGATLLLVSPAGRHISGQILAVDGGATAI